MPTASALFHYTCAHHHPAIQRTGVLLPAKDLAVTRAQRQALAGHPVTRMTCQLIWLTEKPTVIWMNGATLGLTNHALLTCDRTRHRYRVEDGALVMPWAVLRHSWPAHIIDHLESIPGAEPDTWWVSRGPLKAIYDPHRADELVPA